MKDIRSPRILVESSQHQPASGESHGWRADESALRFVSQATAVIFGFFFTLFQFDDFLQKASLPGILLLTRTADGRLLMMATAILTALLCYGVVRKGGK